MSDGVTVALPHPAAAVVALLASVLVGLSTGLSSPSASAAAPAASAAASPAPPPALTVVGRTADGWEVHRLADGRLPAPATAGFRAEVHFVHGGRDRAVRLLVPASARRPAPLLVALHGLYQSAQVAERDMRWGALARREGAVLAYGMGAGASWNAGTCCGRSAADDVDDVGYLDRVLALARALHPVDARRVAVTGFSNGAMMAYRYACERPSVVAGVLAVAGTVTSDCRGRPDVAVHHVHGLVDRTVPLAGMSYSAALGTGLGPVSRAATLFGPTVTARLLPRFGHGWPTSAAGRYDATAAGWAFLQAHPKRG